MVKLNSASGKTFASPTLALPSQHHNVRAERNGPSLLPTSAPERRRAPHV
jgi:hypothetical protein